MRQQVHSNHRQNPLGVQFALGIQEEEDVSLIERLLEISFSERPITTGTLLRKDHMKIINNNMLT